MQQQQLPEGHPDLKSPPTNPNANQGGDPNNTGNADPNAPPAELSMQEMLTAISEELGGAPSGREGAPEMTDVEKTILDNQFAQDTRNQLEDMQKAVKAEAPDATDNQAFNLGMAMMKGDLQGVMQSMRDILKTEKEVDEKGEEQKPLAVEGGASGKPDDNRDAGGLASAFSNIFSTYSTR